jgi:dipeptidyl-peptidase-4
LADRLQGRLLVQHGSADAGAYFAWTMQLVDALIAAGKPVDLMVFPDEGHALRPESEAYAREAAWRYFQQHLQPARHGP